MNFFFHSLHTLCVEFARLQKIYCSRKKRFLWLGTNIHFDFYHGIYVLLLQKDDFDRIVMIKWILSHTITVIESKTNQFKWNRFILHLVFLFFSHFFSPIILIIILDWLKLVNNLHSVLMVVLLCESENGRIVSAQIQF